MVSAFSKVGDIEDDDEDRDKISATAMAEYAKAQKAYESRCSCDEVLKLFERAENTIRPLLGSGLASLEAKELETVLKGRLHQAVSLAQLGKEENWPRIKSLAEDVLQFDFNNAHGRWLRGLALQKQNRTQEAKAECLRAVECARLQGKEHEALQWEKEMRSTFAEMAPEPKKTMAKGFLNRGAKKDEGKEAKAKDSKDSKEAKEAKEAKDVKEEKEAAKEAALREETMRKAEEVKELQSQLQELKQQGAAQQKELQQLENLQMNLLKQLEELPEVSKRHRALDALEVVEGIGVGRTWAEKEQQRFMDVSTELLTLQQMSLREAKEQEEASEKTCQELRQLGTRLAELKRAQLAQLAQDDGDVAQLAHSATAFHQLPWNSKVSAMLEDGTVLWLLAFLVFLGMLFSLALVVEFFPRCRVTCGL